MPAHWVFLTYGTAVALALALLAFFHARAWYWHTISILLALLIGFTPMPSAWKDPCADLLVGSLFLMLFLWGVGAPLFRVHAR